MTDYEKVKKELKLNDNEIDSHETDLYIKYTKERLNYFIQQGFYPEIFTSNIDKKLWLDIPFYLIDDKINKRRILK